MTSYQQADLERSDYSETYFQCTEFEDHLLIDSAHEILLSPLEMKIKKSLFINNFLHSRKTIISTILMLVK